MYQNKNYIFIINYIFMKSWKLSSSFFFNANSFFFQKIFHFNIPLGHGFATIPKFLNSFRYLKFVLVQKISAINKKSSFRGFKPMRSVPFRTVLKLDKWLLSILVDVSSNPPLVCDKLLQ